MPIEGVYPSATRQLLLQHTILPLISVQSTLNADALFQNECNDPLISALLVIRPYGNNARYSVPNQSFRISNLQLISRTYGLFPVRFDAPLPELLTVHNLSDEKIGPLFSISSLEQLLRHASQAPDEKSNSSRSELYFDMFRKVVSSNRIVLFDTLNHPVAHVFVVDYATDSIDTVRQLMVEYRNFLFPKYFQISDVLFHALVVFDLRIVAETEVRVFQEKLRTALSINSYAVPMFQPNDQETNVCMSKFENATVQEQVQHLSLQPGDNENFCIPKTLDQVLRIKLYEFVSKVLLPYMEQKIRLWDDLVLLPKKSITGRLFSVSRKLFNNNADAGTSGTSPNTYNHQDHYYYRSAPEQVIRKLADWSLMLKDFKYAYSTYDLIKKDYTNDKAWVYVASTQEMCIIALLLAQTQSPGTDSIPMAPDKNTLRKIRHDIIEPYIDNLNYTFKLRLNVKTYALRSYLIVAELLLNMSELFSIPIWWDDLIETYFIKAAADMDSHLSASGSGTGPHVLRAILYERVGYAKAISYYIPLESSGLIRGILQDGIQPGVAKDVEEGAHVNSAKILPKNDNAVAGKTRFRKSALWYLLAMWEWRNLDNPRQVEKILRRMRIRYSVDEVTENWYDRKGFALEGFKSYLKAAASSQQVQVLNPETEAEAEADVDSELVTEK